MTNVTYSGIDMAARDTTCNPDTNACCHGPNHVDGEIVLQVE